MTRPEGIVVARSAPSTGWLMRQVMLALLPGTVLSLALLGSGVLLNLLVAVSVGLTVETLSLHWRGRPLRPALADGSMVLAAWLFALCLPPLLPVWQTGFGALCMAALGKHVFGGLGQNPFNPAMVGYATLIVSFPATMSAWSADSMLSLADVWSVKLHAAGLYDWLASRNGAVNAYDWDALTRQTPLDTARTVHHSTAQATTLAQVEALARQSHFVWINATWCAGGLYLLWRRVIGWHIPTAMLASLALAYLVFSSHAGWPVWLHLFSGAAMLGAFFIATDPVSAATSPRGRLIYAAGIGVLTYALREYSAYPDGVAFAVLLMNLCVPLIDQRISHTRVGP